MWFLTWSLACGGSDTPSGQASPTEETWSDPATWPTVLGGDRPARVVAPVLSYQGGRLPLVLLLHGYGASAGLQDFFFALSPDVEELGFVLLLPEGTEDADGRQFWNATEACCDFGGTGVDDLGYLSALRDEALETLPVDPDRVVVLGHSNGGFMAYRLACEDPRRFPAIATLAGAMPWDPEDCEPGAPVAVLQMHGDADTDVIYAGLPGLYPSAEEAVSRFAELAGCEGRPEVAAEADHDSLVAGEETEQEVRAGCERDVQLWHMRGSGHLPIPTARFHEDLRAWLFAER